MSTQSIPGSTRRRLRAVPVALAAFALVLASCGEEGSAEQAVGSATSAAGSAAAKATSAVGDATNRGSEQGSEAGAADPDRRFLDDIRRVGVDVPDEQDYLTRGRDACASLDGGSGYIDVTRQYNEAHPEAPVTEGPVVVAAAVRSLCSQHLPQLGNNDGGGEGQG